MDTATGHKKDIASNLTGFQAFLADRELVRARNSRILSGGSSASCGTATGGPRVSRTTRSSRSGMLRRMKLLCITAGTLIVARGAVVSKVL